MNDLMNEDELAALLRVSATTLQAWRHQRRGPPYVKLSWKTVRYRRADIEAYLSAQVTRLPVVRRSVSPTDIDAAVAAVHGFGNDRAGAAREIQRWLTEEVGLACEANA